MSDSTSSTKFLVRATKPVVVLLQRRPLSRLVLLSALLLLVWGRIGAVLWTRWNDAVEAEVRQNTNLVAVLQEQTRRVISTAEQAMLRVRDGTFKPADLLLWPKVIANGVHGCCRRSSGKRRLSTGGNRRLCHRGSMLVHGTAPTQPTRCSFWGGKNRHQI